MESVPRALVAAEWLSAKDASREISTPDSPVSEKRIHAAIRSGKLRAASIDRRGTVRIHRSWLRAYMEKLADERPADGRDFKAAAAGEYVLHGERR
jgi:hypothetical protein